MSSRNPGCGHHERTRDNRGRRCRCATVADTTRPELRADASGADCKSTGRRFRPVETDRQWLRSRRGAVCPWKRRSVPATARCRSCGRPTDLHVGRYCWSPRDIARSGPGCPPTTNPLGRGFARHDLGCAARYHASRGTAQVDEERQIWHPTVSVRLGTLSATISHRCWANMEHDRCTVSHGCHELTKTAASTSIQAMTNRRGFSTIGRPPFRFIRTHRSTMRATRRVSLLPLLRVQIRRSCRRTGTVACRDLHCPGAAVSSCCPDVRRPQLDAGYWQGEDCTQPGAVGI